MSKPPLKLMGVSREGFYLERVGEPKVVVPWTEFPLTMEEAVGLLSDSTRPTAMSKVWILTYGYGDDSDPEQILGVYSTKAKAEAAAAETVGRCNEPEEWQVDPDE